MAQQTHDDDLAHAIENGLTAAAWRRDFLDENDSHGRKSRRVGQLHPDLTGKRQGKRGSGLSKIHPCRHDDLALSGLRTGSMRMIDKRAGFRRAFAGFRGQQEEIRPLEPGGCDPRRNPEAPKKGRQAIQLAFQGLGHGLTIMSRSCDPYELWINKTELFIPHDTIDDFPSQGPGLAPASEPERKTPCPC